MVTALVAALITALGFSSLMALGYAQKRTRFALLAAVTIAAETVALALVFVAITTARLADDPWLDVSVGLLAKQAAGFAIATALLGTIFFLIKRFLGVGHQTREALLLSILAPVVFLAIIFGVRGIQSNSDSSVPRSIETAPTPTPPPPTPTPTPTPTPGPADSPTALTRHPYLGECTADSVTVAWRTDVASTSGVKYGPEPLLASEKFEPNMTLHHAITLDGLEPGATYYYQVFSNGQPLTSPTSFNTAKARDQKSFSFSVFGDSGIGSSQQFAIAAAVRAAEPDFVLHTGDVVNGDRERAYLIGQGLLTGYEWNTELTPQEVWDPYYFLPYQDLLDNTCFFTAIGNHEVRNAYEDAMYLPHNNAAQVEWYYSFDYGDAHFVTIDGLKASAGLVDAPREEQINWLREDLQRASQDPDVKWKIVFLHHPPFSSGPVQRPGRPGEVIAKHYVPIFEEFGVDLVLTGHDHTYERTCPMLAGACAGPDEKGVLYVVTGGGGHTILEPGVCGADCPWSELRAPVHHFVHVTVDDNTLVGRAIGADGAEVDTFSIEKQFEP